jgi:hypothetical protein
MKNGMSIFRGIPRRISIPSRFNEIKAVLIRVLPNWIGTPLQILFDAILPPGVVII